MANLKYYNPGTAAWETLVIGKQGPSGPAGPTGPAGPGGTAAIASATAPEDTTAIWYNTENGNSYIYYDGFWTSISGLPSIPTGGNTGQVLAKSSSADYATEWVAPSGLELVKTQAIGTAVSGITVTNAFSSKYDNYRVVISGGTIATSLTLSIRMGATATGYYGGSIRVTTASVSSAEGQSNATAYEVGIGAVGTNSPSMTLDILGPFTATKTTFFATSVNSIASAAGGARWNNGWLDNTTSYTDFTFVNGGTITGGTVYVYGYKKA